MFWPSEKHSEFGEKGASQSKIYWNSWDMAFSHHYQGSIDFNTVNIHRNVGMYSLAIGMILNDMIIRDDIIPYTPCSPGNTALETAFLDIG